MAKQSKIDWGQAASNLANIFGKLGVSTREAAESVRRVFTVRAIRRAAASLCGGTGRVETPE